MLELIDSVNQIRQVLVFITIVGVGSLVVGLVLLVCVIVLVVMAWLHC